MIEWVSYKIGRKNKLEKHKFDRRSRILMKSARNGLLIGFVNFFGNKEVIFS